MSTLQDNNASGDLVQKTVKGILWSGFSFVGSKGVTFISTIVLARLLSPDDFGLMALGLLAISYLDTFNGLGVGTVVVYRQDDVERNSNVAFSLSLLVSLLLAVINFFAAPFVADFFRDPRVTDILRVLSINLVISGLSSIHLARLSKDMKFKQSFVPEFGKTVAKAVVSIGFALMGFGVWSLVWGQVAANLVSTLLYWFVYRWMPRLSLNWKVIKGLLNYSSHILMIELMGIFQNSLDYLIIGRRFDVTSLGFYTIAFRVPELIIVNVCAIVSRALFPAFSRIQDNVVALREGYLNTLRYIALYTIPVGVGIALVTSEFVNLAYGDQWLPAIPLMQVLALYSIMYSLSYNAGDLYKATGRPDILTKTSVFELVVAVPLLWFGANYGILYVAYAHLVANILLTIVKLIVVSRLVNIKYSAFFDALRPSVLATVFMVSGVFALQIVLANTSQLIRLLSFSLAGTLIYFGAIWVFSRDVALRVYDMLRKTIYQRLKFSQI